MGEVERVVCAGTAGEVGLEDLHEACSGFAAVLDSPDFAQLAQGATDVKRLDAGGTDVEAQVSFRFGQLAKGKVSLSFRRVPPLVALGLRQRVQRVENEF